jgi:hypothetical protein
MINRARLKNSGGFWGENLLQCYYVHKKSYLKSPGLNLGLQDEKPVSSHLTYGIPSCLILKFKHENFHNNPTVLKSST